MATSLEASSSKKKFLYFAGPAFLVGVGYMDPGNWGTDLAAGSRYGYSLLWVILLSNLAAQFLQVLCAKLGIVTGKDLAEACRDYFSKPTSFILWILCEIAIIACDLAEVIGSAVALNLLFNIPLTYGVIITALDVLILLALVHRGYRTLEAIVISMVLTIFGCFVYEMFIIQPSLHAILVGGFKPVFPDSESLTIAIGIIGATVMPHNLYLHSSLVKSRMNNANDDEKAVAIRFNRFDTIGALSFAFFVNAAILILASAVFGARGEVVEELTRGHELLAIALGGSAATVFAIALLASGQSSTITGTLAGQIVMEGFLRLKIKPWVRRLLSRSIAILPALYLVNRTGGAHTIELLVLSQVILSLQLPFAIFPLMMFTSNKKIMGRFVNSKLTSVIGYTIAVVISALNVYLIATM
jgi:manganese transport protein